MSDLLDFTNQVVLVTGGARGVGRGITQSFLCRGAIVVICGRNAPETPVEAAGKTAHFIAADVKDAAQVEAMMVEIIAKFGRIDVVINNAGGSPVADPTTASARFSESIIKLNLLAPLIVAQAANLRMQQQPNGGAIVNIASVTALRPLPAPPPMARPRPGWSISARRWRWPGPPRSGSIRSSPG